MTTSRFIFSTSCSGYIIRGPPRAAVASRRNIVRTTSGGRVHHLSRSRKLRRALAAASLSSRNRSEKLLGRAINRHYPRST